MLEIINITDFQLENGSVRKQINLSYQVFGQQIGVSPVVLVNHALTGNSNVCGENGWWNQIIGINKVIDTAIYTVIIFNIPGNGFDGDARNLEFDYKQFVAKDIANLFWKGLSHLGINQLFVAIGGSLGGGIAWEMAALQPNRIQHLIPIATDWKATDWVIGNVLIQDQLLNNSNNPVADARLHAMLLYRTPKSINQKFNREIDAATTAFRIENWLFHHSLNLKNRFTLPAYKLMNHLLKTIDITRKSHDLEFEINKISATIHLVSVDSDLLFTAEEIQNTFNKLKEMKSNIFHYQINSIHGHDAFLIENEQLTHILKPIFQNNNNLNYVNI